MKRGVTAQNLSQQEINLKTEYESANQEVLRTFMQYDTALTLEA